MRIKRTKYDMIVGILGTLALVGTSIYLIAAWKDIPAQVPGHYNAAGVADSMTSKGSILFAIIFGWILYLILWGAEQFPQSWNTGVKVTPANQWRVYRVLKNMLVTLRLFLALTFCYLAVCMAVSCQKLPTYYLLIILAGIFGDIIFSWIMLVRVSRLG